MSYYLGIGYGIGCWAYAMLYMWENWGGISSVGALAVHGFFRAIIWPVWLVLYMVN